MKLNKDRWYSLLEVQRLCKIKSRQYLVKYINEGKLLAIQTGSGGPSTGVRYTIKGEWVIEFNQRYKKGLVQYSKEETKAKLEDAIKNLK